MVTFNGYLRQDGQVGIRNHVVVIPTSSSLGGVVRRIVRAVPQVRSLAHSSNYQQENSCYHSQMLRSLGMNPNHGAVIYVGLGSEMDDAKQMAADLAASSGKLSFGAIVSEDGGTDGVVELCIKKAKEFVDQLQNQKRVACPISGIILGEECGGSDALSGVTANPALGYLSDWLIDNGGTTILAEMEELKGCEEFIAKRCIDPAVAQRITKTIKAFPMQPIDQNMFYNRGGMSNILEKSLGCYYKAGKADVTDFLDYGEPVGTRRGLLLMDGSAADLDSVAGAFAAGAQILVFTTGNGNPIGFPSCPVVKVSSNPERFEAMGGEDGDFDINAGVVVSKGMSVEEVGELCIRKFMDYLNGEQTAGERKGNGGIVNFERRATMYSI